MSNGGDGEKTGYRTTRVKHRGLRVRRVTYICSK